MKSFLLLIGAFLLLNVMASAKHLLHHADKPGYTIKIKVKGLKDKDTCLLAYYYGDKQYIKDTAYSDANGSMVFAGKEDLPNGIYLVVFPNKRYFEFIGKEQNFSMETDTAHYVNHMKVKNSSENQIFYEYLKFIGEKGKKIDSLRKEYDKVKNDTLLNKPIRQQMVTVDNEVKTYKANTIKTNPGTFVAMLFKAMEEVVIPDNPNPKDSTYALRYYRAHYFDNMRMDVDDLIRTPLFHEKIKTFMDNYYKHPDSICKTADIIVKKAKANKELFKYCVWWITNTHESATWMGADAVFVHMVKNYYSKDQAYWLDSTRLAKIQGRAKILEPLLIGKKAPQMFLQDTSAALNSGNKNGKPFISLHQVKAKYTVMIFWDPECGHCQKEVPKLYKEFYTQYKSKGVEVYAINATHAKLEAWKKFIKEHKLDWINVHDSGPYYDFNKTYDIYSYPVIYLLDQDKIIKAKRLGVEQLSEVIDGLEKEQQAQVKK